VSLPATRTVDGASADLGTSTPSPFSKQAAQIVSEKETGKEVNRMLKVRPLSCRRQIGGGRPADRRATFRPSSASECACSSIFVPCSLVSLAIFELFPLPDAMEGVHQIERLPSPPSATP
jgi:hypothetical protein